ncbi:T9SS type A sorting domain-containing protein [Mucilaginibacter lacusdianchii]|uniref:T9SS type A sorting domain-containing protein n=1 Tax=Mucilaginibacter lacusdianchii TaxID=2684211 RepID=UPI00131ADBDB|nr:T9SS type A sorting domain-containing protein [Mucilaginibacter sp. JXJ CY 39]
MGQRYTFKYLWITIIAIAISINFAFSGELVKLAKSDSSFLFRSKNVKKTYFKNSFLTGTLPTFKPVSYTAKPAVDKQLDDKLLTNVQVFPNPVTDQINLRYTVSRNSNVTIKLMDVLGNNVATFSQRVDPGEQKFTHYISNRLTSGFYFVRVMAGTESVIRRITVL